MTPALAAWIGGGTGLLGLVGAIAALLKARPEAKKIKAETVKVLTDASASIVASVNTQMERMAAEVADLKKKLDERERREERQERLLLAHQRWDLDITYQVRELGGHVSDPPPLYPDPTAA